MTPLTHHCVPLFKHVFPAICLKSILSDFIVEFYSFASFNRRFDKCRETYRKTLCMPLLGINGPHGPLKCVNAIATPLHCGHAEAVVCKSCCKTKVCTSFIVIRVLLKLMTTFYDGPDQRGGDAEGRFHFVCLRDVRNRFYNMHD